ncbi:MAG: preprotein translocase subunit YajC [Gammaproteobacteria bacterium]|nr:preprotein translocase subunit YajC [Gammaproteobacteria bacterium]
MNLIPTALAAAPTVSTTAASSGSPWSTVIMLVVFFAIFYFLLIRPQSKKAKQHREMISNIGKGDEIITNGGIYARVVEIDETTITLEIAPGVNIKQQKGAIASVLPKGSIK